MGSAPTQKMEADLNGTGTLVDITAYVDQSAGIEHSWGRSDWTSPEPSPGTLAFTLENLDGRFTPGVTAVYTVGCVVGTLVQWTCGARVRRFRMGVPAVTFPDGVAGSSMVSVQCFDALQLLAAKKMHAMVDETVLNRTPAAYWVLNEAAADPVTATVAADSSGNGESAMVPWGVTDATAFSWASGNGPDMDGRASLKMLEGSWAGLQATLVGAYDWTNQGSGGSGYKVWGASMWLNIDDLYGVSNMGAASTAGPFVHLITVGSTEIFWDAPHRGIAIHDTVTGGSTSWWWAYGSTFPINPDTYNHLAFAVRAKKTAAYANGITIWVNGSWMADFAIGTTAPATMPGLVRMGGHIGTPAAAIGAVSNFAGFAGVKACVSIHLPPSIRFTTTGDWATPITDMYPAGMGTGPEDAAARFQRLGAMLGNPAIAFAPQGSARPMALSGQRTDGKSMLAAMCEALRAEDAGLDTIVTGGVETVRAWLYGSQKPYTSVLSVDVSADCEGIPELTFDGSGVAVEVTAKNEFTGTSVVWLDKSADARWRGTSASLSCLLALPEDILVIAQYRALLGRITGVVPQLATVDAVTSKADLTAALLDLHPWVTITAEGFPDNVVGYGSVRCYLSGVKESHRYGSSMFALSLLPTLLLPSTTTVDPGTGTEGSWRLSYFESGKYSICGNAQATLTAVATTVYLYTSKTDASIPFLSTAAADYPLDLNIDGETIHCPNAASTALVASGSLWWQSLTGVTRGYAGTTAATHGYSLAQVLSIVNPETISGVHVDPFIQK